MHYQALVIQICHHCTSTLINSPPPVSMASSFVLSTIAQISGQTIAKDIQMPKASARHILVDSEAKCNDLKQKIADGANFADVAREHSTCPSGAQSGNLGSFGPGMMVPEFDKVVFSGEIGEVYGPVQTQFGYHLVEITSRDD